MPMVHVLGYGPVLNVRVSVLFNLSTRISQKNLEVDRLEIWSAYDLSISN